MRLTNDLYLVGGGNAGFNLSDDADCHVYVLDTGDGLALIDAGTGLGTDAILRNIREDGLDPGAIANVFVTHYHVDHAGGLARWQRLTGARVHASSDSASALRIGDADTVGLTQAQAGGYYPADYVLEPSSIDVELAPGEAIQAGRHQIRAIDAAGHCRGHLVFHVQGGDRTYLFSGDCLFWGGTIILQNIADCSIPEYAATMERLHELTFDALLPGHLTISLRNGQRHVETAVRAFRSLGLPRQAIQL